MKNRVSMILAPAVAAAVALGSFAVTATAQDFDHDFNHGHSEFHGFVPGSIVVSGTVYVGNAGTVIPGEVLPPGCLNTGSVTNPTPATVNVPLLPADQTSTTTTTAATVTCGYASDNGEYPNLHDNHNVWNNANTDGSFGVSSPIVLWDLSTSGALLGTLPVPGNEMVTSFSSKSELALNRSIDGKTLTFMGYRGGPGCPTLTLDPVTNILTQGTNMGPMSPTAANLLDVSGSSTPGLCDPTNPAVASYTGASNPTAYYRSVAEVNASGHIFMYTDGNAYSGDNSRAAIEAGNGLYYSVGNDNSGGLGKKQVPETQLGYDLSHSTGAELFVPGATPLVPPNNNMISYFAFTGDKPGKDTNFRGLTVFDGTLYVVKGSGGNGINTIYQLGTPGVLPTPGNAPAGGLINEPYTILPGFPTSTSTTANAGGYYPFGIWFANATTLYVCNEGDLNYTPNQVINGQMNVADSSTLATAGLQKWVLTTAGNGSQAWVLQYTIQNGLDLGLPYNVPNYPASIEPATGGCRNIAGVVHPDGTATVYAVTSTISLNGDNGADPNKVVKVTDQLSATKLSTNGYLDRFETIRPARAGEAFRGVALAPVNGR